MKKQALSLFLAGALALSLFGCSAQPAAESVPQSSPAETAGSSSAGVVEELHLGTTAANDTFTTFVESGAFGKMCYNSFVTAPFWQTGPNGEVEPFLVTDWTVSEDSTTITCDLALNQGITWHDGEPLTMDDVLFTFDYNINVRKSSYSSYVDHAEQVDEDTIKVVLKEPGAYQWLKLVAGYFYVQPKHIDHRRGEGRRYHRGLPGGRWGGLFHPGELRRLCAYVSQAHLGRNRGSLRLHRRGCCHRLRPLSACSGG